MAAVEHPGATHYAYLAARTAFVCHLSAVREAAATFEPVEGYCPRCREPVLILLGGELVAEPIEIMPEYPCPECENIRGRGWRRLRQCWRCFGLGTVGEPLPPYGIALAADGSARPFTAKCPPREGEAAHLEHACSLVPRG